MEEKEPPKPIEFKKRAKKLGRPPKDRPLLSAVVANPPRGTPKKKKSTSDDPLLNDIYIKTFINLVAEAVPYSQFIELDPPLSIDGFLKLRNLYIIDRFYQYSDEEILERIGYEASTLANLRRHVHFQVIGEAVAKAALLLSKPRTFDQWAEDSENRVAAEFMTVALAQKNPKEKMAALSAFADRRSAKKGREEEQRPPILFPENFLRAMAKAMEMTPAAVQIESSGVDASRLNVPTTKRIGG